MPDLDAVIFGEAWHPKPGHMETLVFYDGLELSFQLQYLQWVLCGISDAWVLMLFAFTVRTGTPRVETTSRPSTTGISSRSQATGDLTCQHVGSFGCVLCGRMCMSKWKVRHSLIKSQHDTICSTLELVVSKHYGTCFKYIHVPMS
jgi:hypothetical protein